MPTLRRYRELVSEYAAAGRRHQEALAAAESAYAEGIAAAERDLAAAGEAVARAAAGVTRAQRVVAHTDLVAASLWEDLRKVRRRIGPLPDPADSSTTDSEALLKSAAARIERARRGGGPLPGRVLPLLFLLGAATAAVLTAVAALVAWPVLLAAPLSGLPLARFWVDRRYETRLDPGAIAVTILGATLATATTWLALR